MPTTASAHRPRRAVAVALAVLLGTTAVTVGEGSSAGAASGSTYSVDGSATTCTDTGTGTAAAPFCTISAAVRRAVTPGDTVRVAPGTYREQVTPTASGAAGNPITIAATGTGVLVLGTRYLGATAWTASPSPAPAGTWQTGYAPPATPRQVLLGDTRLTQATSASTVGPQGWFYDATAKVLLVNLGGPSPIGQAIEAGAQSYGVNLVGLHDVVVRGLDTRGAGYAGTRVNASTRVEVRDTTSDQGGSNGILVEAASSSVLLASVVATRAVSVGIRISASSAVTVQDSGADHNGLHGISTTSSPGTVLTRNRSDHNVAVTGTATAAGIDVSGSSTDAQVTGNVTWANQDTGIQVATGAHRPLLARNLSYANGDHGLHVLGATGAVVVNNTSTGNRRDGLAVEGSSTGARSENNVLTENGAATGEYNLMVDTSSATGLVADYDLAWNSTTRNSVKVSSTAYRSLTAYAAASGQEAHGLAYDPGLVDPSKGDLRLGAGSVAVDSADAGAPGFIGTGVWTPLDDTAVPDRGAGTPTYADRAPSSTAPHP